AAGAHSTLDTTYKVPDTVSPGDVLNTGAGGTVALGEGRWVEHPINTCVTIREPNAAEAVTGSLDDLGFGSATAGSTTSSGISSDPSGFIADIINDINIGELIGLSCARTTGAGAGASPGVGPVRLLERALDQLAVGLP